MTLLGLGIFLEEALTADLFEFLEMDFLCFSSFRMLLLLVVKASHFVSVNHYKLKCYFLYEELRNQLLLSHLWSPVVNNVHSLKVNF